MSNSSASSLGASGGVAVAPTMSASAIVAQVVSGSHVLRIDGYSRTTGLGAGKFIVSRSFAVRGHRWCLGYYPDGYGNDPRYPNWVAISLGLDPIEGGEVRAQWKISLLDQQGQPVASHVNKCETSCSTFSAKLQSHYHFLSIGKAELQNPLYLKDDAFSVRCDITVVTGIVAEDVVIPAVERDDIKKRRMPNLVFEVDRSPA